MAIHETPWRFMKPHGAVCEAGEVMITYGLQSIGELINPTHYTAIFARVRLALRLRIELFQIKR
jgi:hypothetical protein